MACLPRCLPGFTGVGKSWIIHREVSDRYHLLLKSSRYDHALVWNIRGLSIFSDSTVDHCEGWAATYGHYLWIYRDQPCTSRQYLSKSFDTMLEALFKNEKYTLNQRRESKY